MKRNRVTDRQVINESDAIDATTYYFDAFTTQEQLTSDQFQVATGHSDEIAAQRNDVTPANSTLVQHVEGDARVSGAQQTKPRIHGEDVKIVLGHTPIPGGSDEGVKSCASPMRESLVK